MSEQYIAFWFRRDLRWDDNHGLFEALNSSYKVLPVFIFDREILDSLPQQDLRVQFIHQTLHKMQSELIGLEKSLIVRYGKPVEIWKELTETYNLNAVYTNHDYEPYARERDSKIAELFSGEGIAFHTFKDQVIFEKEEILTNAGKPYTVFTPYSKKWKSQLSVENLHPFASEKKLGNLLTMEAQTIPPLEEMGFKAVDFTFPGIEPSQGIISIYDQKRNFPAIQGTSRLGIHLRFGTISLRRLASIAVELNETYLNELIWREFYMQILWNFPHVASEPFRREYGKIPWEQDEELFEKWCLGKTGFPIVDAGMRELNATGYMHNRVRMITASFLVKDLLLDWRKGEAYFAEKLLDFELSSNNGGWQWAAGSGTDAAPYFRIFNPESQMKKFDPELKYVRRWVPEFGTPTYPKPVVDHNIARKRTLEVFKKILKNENS